MSNWATPAAPGASLYAKSTRSSNLVGALLFVAGVVAILLPLLAGVAVTAIVGWLLLLAGVAHFFFAWSARGAGSVLWQILLGVLYVGVALYMIGHPAQGLVTLTLLLASYFVIEGVLELVMYMRMRRSHRASSFLWNGIVTLFLGALIWAQWPFSSAWALGTLIGISLIFSGIARLHFRHGLPLTGSPMGGATPA